MAKIIWLQLGFRLASGRVVRKAKSQAAPSAVCALGPLGAFTLPAAGREAFSPPAPSSKCSIFIWAIILCSLAARLGHSPRPLPAIEFELPHGRASATGGEARGR